MSEAMLAMRAIFDGRNVKHGVIRTAKFTLGGIAAAIALAPEAAAQGCAL
ncbi:MAG: hypothetical protein ACRD4R_13990 [Candidatus Acidiferrales bacterium]